MNNNKITQITSINKFFSEVFTEDVENVPTKANETNESLRRIRITEEEIKEKIGNLKDNSAAGPDGIGPKLLKATANQIVKGH